MYNQTWLKNICRRKLFWQRIQTFPRKHLFWGEFSILLIRPTNESSSRNFCNHWKYLLAKLKILSIVKFHIKLDNLPALLTWSRRQTSMLRRKQLSSMFRLPKRALRRKNSRKINLIKFRLMKLEKASTAPCHRRGLSNKSHFHD